jgi:hypothetical protein
MRTHPDDNRVRPIVNRAAEADADALAVRSARANSITRPIVKPARSRTRARTPSTASSRWDATVRRAATSRASPTVLAAVDRPIVIPRPGDRIDADLASHLPAAERAPAPGPAGWNAAILAVLAGRRLPTVGEPR